MKIFFRIVFFIVFCVLSLKVFSKGKAVKASKKNTVEELKKKLKNAEVNLNKLQLEKKTFLVDALKKAGYNAEEQKQLNSADFSINGSNSNSFLKITKDFLSLPMLKSDFLILLEQLLFNFLKNSAINNMNNSFSEKLLLEKGKVSNLAIKISNAKNKEAIGV